MRGLGSAPRRAGHPSSTAAQPRLSNTQETPGKCPNWARPPPPSRHADSPYAHLAAEAARIGHFESDLLTGHTRWSAAQGRLYGLEPGAYDGSHRAFLALLHPEDRRRVDARLAELTPIKLTQWDMNTKGSTTGSHPLASSALS